jgi:hypothetical protein
VNIVRPALNALTAELKISALKPALANCSTCNTKHRYLYDFFLKKNKRGRNGFKVPRVKGMRFERVSGQNTTWTKTERAVQIKHAILAWKSESAWLMAKPTQFPKTKNSLKYFVFPNYS